MNTSNQVVGTVALKRRPSAGRTRARLPWNNQTTNADGVSLASSSGVSSTASPRIVENTSQSTSIFRENPYDASPLISSGQLRRSRRIRIARSDHIDLSGSRSLPSSVPMSPLPRNSSCSIVSRGNAQSSSTGLSILPSTENEPKLRRATPNIPKPGDESPLPSSSFESVLPMPVVFSNFSPPLLPVRARIARQSSRSRLSHVISTSKLCGSSEPVRQSYPNDKTDNIWTRTSQSYHSPCDQPSPKDYDPDDYVDVERDIPDDDEEDEDEETEQSVRDGEGLNDISDADSCSNSTAKPPCDNLCDKPSSRLTKLSSDISLNRSIDSEASDVSSVRSAASHRRAMRLFQEAEQRNLMNDPLRRSICQPLHVSVSEASCPTPILAPAVTPALPINRALIRKGVSKRRGTLTNPSMTCASQGLSDSSSSVDMKTTNVPNNSSTGRFASPQFSVKCDSFSDATSHASHSSLGPVIGRGARETQPTSTPDLYRLSNDRRPLKGQHNIVTNLSPQSLGTTPQSDHAPTFPLITAASCSPINVVGRSVFESQQATHQPDSKTSPNHPSNIRGKNSVGLTSAEEPVAVTHPKSDDIPIHTKAIRSANEFTDDNTKGIQKSGKLRQQVLRKKTKELQKLRQVCVNSKKVEAEPTMAEEDGTHKDPQPNFTGDIHGINTWPPPSVESFDVVQSRNSDSPVGKTPDRTVQGLDLQLQYKDKKIPLRAAQPIEMKASPKRLSRIHRVQSSSVLNTDSDSRLASTAVENTRLMTRGQSALNLHSALNLSVILQLINNEDWESKVSGLESLSRLASDQPTVSSPKPPAGISSAGSVKKQLDCGIFTSDGLNQAVQAVIIECRNLRSQVSRQAVQTLCTLFHGLGKMMDPHVETCVRVLLGKTGEAAAAFLRDEVAAALDELSQAASPCRSLSAYMLHGLGHKNPTVRLQTSLQMSRILEALVSANSSAQFDSRFQHVTAQDRLSGCKISAWNGMGSIPSTATAYPPLLSSLMDKLVPAISQFLTDGNQETRYYGRRLLKCLKDHPDFERNVRKLLTGSSLRAVQDAIDLIRAKGIGEPPSVSAGARRRGYSPARNASALRGSSASNISKS